MMPISDIRIPKRAIFDCKKNSNEREHFEILRLGSIHEMGELKSTKIGEKVMTQYRSALHKYTSCKRG